MDALELFQRIAAQYPESEPRVTQLPTGLVMLDFTCQGVRFCAESIPSRNAFGLSRVEGASPFYEGYDELFESPGQLEARVREMMANKE